MPVTPAFAALHILLFLVLSIRTIRTRRSAQVALGNGSDDSLTRAARVHANFAEYAPFTLLAIWSAETLGVHVVIAIVLNLLLLTGRIIHAWGVSQPNENFTWRVAGMSLTFFALAGAALAICAAYLMSA